MYPLRTLPADLLPMRLFYALCAAALTLAFVLAPDPVLSSSGGAPAGHTGSPLSGGQTCATCHRPFEVNSGPDSVWIEAPATFAPGETVTLTVHVANSAEGSPRQGFQVSVEDTVRLGHVGMLVVDEVNTQTVGAGNHFATHTGASNEDTSWTVGWTAPADAPDSVTVFAAGNATNNDLSPTGDHIYTTSVTMVREGVANEPEAVPLAARLGDVFPNPSAGAATLAYALDRPMAVTLTLYDGVGRVVRVLERGTKGAGDHTLRLAGDGLPAGTYFVEIRSAAGAEVRAVTFAR